MAQRTPQQDRRLFEILDKWTERLDQSEKRIIALKSALEETTKGSQLYAKIQQDINKEEKKRAIAQRNSNAQQTRANKAHGEYVDEVQNITKKASEAKKSVESNMGEIGGVSGKIVDSINDLQIDITKKTKEGQDASLSTMLLDKLKESSDNFADLFGDEAGGGFMGIDYDELEKIRANVEESGDDKAKSAFKVYEGNLLLAQGTKDTIEEAQGLATKFGDKIGSQLGKIPLIGGKIKGAFDESMKQVSANIKQNLLKQLKAGNKNVKGMGKGFRGTIPAIRAMGSALMTATGGLTLLLGLLAAAAVALVGLATKARDYATDQGIAFTQSVKLQGSIMAAKAKMIGLDMDAGKIAGEMIGAFGTLDRVNSRNIAQIGKLSRRFGVGTNDLITFQKAFTDVTGASVDVANDVVRAVGSMATGAGVAAGKVIADIAGNMEAFARFSQGGADGMAKAAIEAAKIGSSLGEVVKVADSLLNFEQSITSEFEAQVLTGKSLNLERARAAALQGDFATLTAEIQQQVGGLGNLQSMNVIQKDAIAGALGLSVSELTKIARGEAIEDEDSPELKEQKRTNQILIDGFTGNKESLDNLGKKSADSSGGMFGDFL